MLRFAFTVLIALSFSSVLAQPKAADENEKKLPVNQSVSKARDRWLGEDKVTHFFVSGFLTAYGYSALHQTFDSPENTALSISSIGVTGLGLTKEIYDFKSKKGHPSFKDILANLLGVGTALFLVKVL